MKSQRPKDNPVVQFSLKVVDRVLKGNVWGIDIVGEIGLEQCWQVFSKRLYDSLCLQLIFTCAQTTAL